MPSPDFVTYTHCYAFLPCRHGAVLVTVAVAVVVQFMIHFLRRQDKRNVSVLCVSIKSLDWDFSEEFTVDCHVHIVFRTKYLKLL